MVLTDGSVLDLREYLTKMNALNESDSRHDVGIFHEGLLDLFPCFLTEVLDRDFKLSRGVDASAIFCARCGIVAPCKDSSNFLPKP
eukprot:3874287-Amphidinium_carterae.1